MSGCSSCNKKKNINLSKLDYSRRLKNAGNNEYLINNKFGRIMYFLILVVVALSPIVNLFVLYMFYMAVFGKKKEQKQEDVEVNKNKNTAE